jgi:atypical dual specificity phosphatase
MPVVTEFLKNVEELDCRVMVHCIAGVSRSVSVIILHFLLHHKFRLKHIFNYIKSCRPFIAMNEGFKLQC